MNKEDEVMHALGHHPWVYMIHVVNRWLKSFDPLDVRVLKHYNGFPLRACPICGRIEEKYGGEWSISRDSLRPATKAIDGITPWNTIVLREATDFYEKGR